MGIFNEFFKKEKPIFTGSRFGFGSGAGGPGAPVPFQITGADITSETIVGDHTVYKFSSSGSFEVVGGPGDINFFFVGGGGKGGGGRSGGGGGGGMRWVVNDPADPNFANTPTTPNYVDVSDGSYTVQVGRGGGKAGVSTPNSGETSFTSISPTVLAGGGGNLTNGANGYGAGGGGGNGDGGGQNNYGNGNNGGGNGGKGTEGQGGGGGGGCDVNSPIGGGNNGLRPQPSNPDSNMQNVIGGQAILVSPKIPWLPTAEGINGGYFAGGGAGSADRSTNSSYHNASFTGGQGSYPPNTSGTAGSDGTGGGGGGNNPGGDGVVYLAIYNG